MTSSISPRPTPPTHTHIHTPTHTHTHTHTHTVPYRTAHFNLWNFPVKFDIIGRLHMHRLRKKANKNKTSLSAAD